ncbi:FMN-binding glutamate synthase family protein [Pyrofollis japonicus]|uniref:FMN-binding glutamate synthase family protein n=1 Tax=Pyrofollis japonicus TaxID=3060460 RepID=UPI00295AA562|nr:glutamate synthase-related protein [Pyrofollis japonicus]BEP16935.1 FMN-binding glutamate synthase family protein [Pyrofollis japonicus]
MSKTGKSTESIIVNEYRPLIGDRHGFWTREKILEIRYAATEALEKAVVKPLRRRGRILDRLAIRDIRPDEVNDLAKKLGPTGLDRLDVDAGLMFAGTRLRLPVYLGDMSFGALAGRPNIALARAADEAGAVIGVGEGGLHPEVAKYKNIVIQWASGRFGVDRYMIRKGIAVNIKIGQGAKPGIGGHLPATKVVDEIAKLRRLPPGTEALSPAPHHDIYSIEDLAQRVKMLKELTGRPVLVKTAAGHQVGFVAVGIARSTALGAIIDGAGAGTGAAPRIVRDHIGIPVDYAIPVADKLLRANGLRDGFLLIGGGMIYSGEDIAKLIFLGANMANIGTAALIAMGCIMCHLCNTGKCPTALTSSLTHPLKLDVDWATHRAVNWLKAIERSLKLITYVLGEDSLQKLVGRKDLLEAYNIDEEVADTIGVEAAEPGQVAWYADGTIYDVPREVYEKAKTPVVGMGGIVPGYTSPAERPLDLLRIEAAQVTRPSIDPYREEISLETRLFDGTTYEAPIVVPCSDEALVEAATALGLPLECDLMEHPEAIALPPGVYPPIGARIVIVDEKLRGGNGRSKPWLEEWVVRLDDEYWRNGIRDSVTIVASGQLRHGADVYKLIALGADMVLPIKLFKSLASKLRDKPLEKRREAYENTLIELMWEIKLLMGAGGVTSYESLHGNRWLLRSLDGLVSRLLGVSLAGR